MNKIKRTIGLLLLALPLLGLFTGCKKFLDRKPLTATLSDLNQGGLEGQIYGLYGAIRNGDVAGQAFGGIPWMAMNNFRSDDSEKGSSTDDGADWGVIFDKFQYVKDHWSTDIYWDQHYVLIGLANTALQTADSLKLSQPADLVNQAEAKFFRAFSYFDLVRAYGQVPKIDFRVYNAQDANKPKASLAELFTLIDNDLTFAETYLPTDWNNPSGQSRFPGRLTKYAALALHAKTQMYRNPNPTTGKAAPSWGTVLGLAQQVIASGRYSLDPSFAHLWTNAGENGVESLFEIQAYIGPNGSDNNYSWYGIAQGVRGSGDWDLGWGWNTPTQNLVDAFVTSNDDTRRKATILYSGQDDGYGRIVPSYPTIPRLYWNKKVYPEPAMQALTGERQAGWVNQRVLRYADVLLMAAEAANELGGAANQDLAVKYVNLVRRRAGLSDVTFTTQAAMRAIIQNERRLELAMEGDRFYDLVRWGIATDFLSASGYLNKHRYYPIPQPAIDKSNGVLVQNPEWP